MSHREWDVLVSALVSRRTDEIVRDFGDEATPSELLALADEVEAAGDIDDKARIMAAMVARELRRRAAASLN